MIPIWKQFTSVMNGHKNVDIRGFIGRAKGVVSINLDDRSGG